MTWWSSATDHSQVAKPITGKSLSFLMQERLQRIQCRLVLHTEPQHMRAPREARMQRRLRRWAV